MTKLHLADDLFFPAEAVTQTFGILAVRGAGKSNAAAVMAEGMFAATIPFVVIDPVGSWFGLRSSADGKSPGLPIPIFGGRHADVPLEKTGGQLLADLVVDQRLTCVLDLSELSEGDKTRFLIDFAERLYRRNTEPLHLFLEEADDFIPQRPFREQARLVRAWENVVRRGRARGLGMTMITQRSAAINKNVLTQAETLIVLRTTSPQDRKAIEAWVEYHGQSKELLESLPGLENGEAWVWSPSWLKVLKRVRVHRRATYDSGATPKSSGKARPAANLADIDLGAIRGRMADTIERAKADDPKELRRQIADLKRQLAERPAAEPVQVSVLADSDLEEMHAIMRLLQKAVAEAEATRQAFELVGGRWQQALDRVAGGRTSQSPPAPRLRQPHAHRQPVASEELTEALNHLLPDRSSRLPIGERAILTACAQHPDGCTREQLSVLTGYKRSSRDTYLQRLREKGYVDPDGERIRATKAGVAALGADFRPLPTGEGLRAYWLDRLPEGERRVLEILLNTYPAAVPRESLDAATGYKRSSRDTYLQRLRARQLVTEAGRGEVRASVELFD